MLTDIENIKNSNILEKTDLEFLIQLSSELNDTFDKTQIFRTETEMYISVLNDIKFPTNSSKYWQAVKEQAAMLENLIASSFEFRRNELLIKKFRERIDLTNDFYEKEELQINIDECIFKRINMQRIARDRLREIKLWSRIKFELDDGSFDTKDVNVHQLISYTQRFIMQASNISNTMSISEINNLKGQLISSLREVKARGLLDTVLSEIPCNILKKVLTDVEILKLKST